MFGCGADRDSSPGKFASRMSMSAMVLQSEVVVCGSLESGVSWKYKIAQ